MDFFYWLLARCQQAVWGMNEVSQAFLARDIEALRAVDLPRAHRDFLFVTFAAIFGYGPLLS